MKKFLHQMLLALSLLSVAAFANDRNDESLYQLPASLTDQDGRAFTLDRYRGHRVVVAMFYGSCPNTCPLLIETIRTTESALKPENRESLRVLLISIDPERDTPSALAELSKTRHIDTRRWTLASAPANDVRAIAAALNVSYRRLPNGDYNHTSVLTLLSPEGAIVAQTSKLGKVDSAFVAAISR